MNVRDRVEDAAFDVAQGIQDIVKIIVRQDEIHLLHPAKLKFAKACGDLFDAVKEGLRDVRESES